MVPSSKISSAQEPPLTRRDPVAPPRRPTTTYGTAFFIALVLGILSALGFLSLLVFAVAN